MIGEDWYSDYKNQHLESNSLLIEILQQRSKNQPDKTAYIFLQNGETESGSLTYRELDRKARAIAVRLQSWQGERALLLYPSGLEFITAFFGCLYAGVIAVPVYPPRRNQKLSRLLSIANDAQAKVALTTTFILSSIEKRWSEDVELAQLKLVATDTIKTNLKEFVPKSLVPESLAFLQYTSGSTGTPKGVMVTHGNIIHNQQLIHQAFGHTEKSIGIGWLPLFHDMGLIGHVLQPIYVGFPSILMPPLAFLQKPIRWLKVISRYRATTSGGPNFAYDLCVKKVQPEQLANLDLSSWDLAYSGAEPVRAETLEQFREKFASRGFNESAFYPCYGMAETTLFATGGEKNQKPVVQGVKVKELEQNLVLESEISSTESRVLVGVGRPYLDTKVSIVNPESLTRCERGQVGEIWVSGGSVTSGYWNRLETTRETFKIHLKDGKEGSWLRTGDLGFFSNGELFVTGRLKDLIIVRGRNYYPQDIELTVDSSHPSLREHCSAAFSVEIEGEERLVVACEVERTYLRKLNTDEVVREIQIAVSTEHELEVYGVVLFKTGSIPKTSSGKIQRHACKQGFLEDSLNVVGQWKKTLEKNPQIIGSNSQPNTQDYSSQKSSKTVAEIEAWLASKIAELLQLSPDKIDLKQPLAIYGLNSVKAVSIAAELEEWLEISVAPTIVYDYPTIQGLADYLGQTTPLLESPASAAKPQITNDVNDAVAIVGKGCRFPQADNPQAFWSLLRSGDDAITQVPVSRWQSDSAWGGFLEKVDQFDPQFFNISPREASNIDPQQRLLLEVAWEALEDAGLAAERLTGSRGGVFIGISSGDYARLGGNLTNTEAYYSTGNALSIAANRLSYFLDWHGPSWAVDTACSSSLVAVHQACQSLLHGECNLALAGGVNLILSPQLTSTFSEAQMMAADGRCKTFDAEADGYVRSEGCGVVLLKRLDDALAEGDNIQAIIRGSAVNQDGLTNGLTAPNGKSQQKVIRLALAKAGVRPNQISYVETHGTGTFLGDPIEINSLKAVLMEGRDSNQPCWIGSAKTNIGHLEAAAGIAGLIKLLLSLEHGEIPPHLNLKQLNPHIKLDRTPIKISTQLQQWSSVEQPRLAGISAFGFGGTNAHVILEEAPVRSRIPYGRGKALQDNLREDRRSTKFTNEENFIERPIHLLTLSAKTEEALEALCLSYQTHLKTHEESAIADICFTANSGRSHFNHRLAIIASEQQELAAKLAKISAREEVNGVFSGNSGNSRPPKIAFLFSGQGSQYVNMGRQLYETQPLFRRTLDQCEQILQSYLEKSILEVIYSENTEGLNNSVIDQTAYTQPALFAIEYALAKLWQSWGIEPDIVMGHSVGEYVAATIAGVFSLEDGLKLIATRGKLMQQLPAGGIMVSLMASAQQVREAISKCFGESESATKTEPTIAAINGPRSTVISGAEKTVQSVVTELEKQGIASRRLQVSHAFHSHLMQPILSELRQVFQQVSYSMPQIDIISNVTGQIVIEEVTQPDYWCRHILSTVNFAAGMETLHRHGCEIFLECGPKRTLLSMGRKCLPKVGVWLSSLRPSSNNWQNMLASLGELYARGTNIDWFGFDRDYSQRRKVSLPTYPFQRRRYWLTTRESIAMSQDGLSSDSTKSKTQLKQHKEQNQVPRLEKILEVLRSLIGSVLQLHPDEVEIYKPLLEMGADSIVFLEAGQKLEETFGVRLTIRQLFEELNTLDALANYIDSHMPDEFESKCLLVDEENTLPVGSSSKLDSLRDTSTSDKDSDSRESSSTESINQQSNSFSSPVYSTQVGITALERVMSQQLQTMSQLMTEQLSVLRDPDIVNKPQPATQPEQNATTFKTNKLGPFSPQPSNSIIREKIPQIGTTKSKEFFWERREYKPALGELQEETYEGKASLLGDKVMQFSLYYFGSYEAKFSKNKYNLLFEGAKFADRNSFTAVWVPERHFHAFGGFSPNPSVLAAALARETQSIKLRAGSVVLPLQHPIRIAEDWSVIDNISEGRVGVSFASGWHPHDFVLAPDAYNCRRELMFEGIETVQKLWRGEPLQFIDGTGSSVKIETFPMPMQKELPSWVTVVNNPETYIKAGEIGAGVLTNLMGQTIEDLIRNIKLYRKALAQHGHEPDTGQVTVLLHTFVGNDQQQVREIARKPFQDYLNSSLGLFQAMVKSQGLKVANFEQLSENDKNYMLSAVYERYVQTSALIGTPESCAEIVEKLLAIGVDEIACFIDFGVEPENVLASLPYLNELREIFQKPQTSQEESPNSDSDLLYTLEWQNQPLSFAEDKLNLAEATGRWLIFADEQGIGNSLAARLSDRGQTCSLIYPSDNHITSNVHDTHIIDSKDSNAFSELLENYTSNNQLPIRGIVYLWSINTPEMENLTIDVLEEVQQLVCGSALFLVQAAISKIDSRVTSHKFWFVTQQAVMPADVFPTGAIQASLWGFARTLALEYPDNWGALIDLDTHLSIEERARELVTELTSSQNEDQIALHQGKRYVARLIRHSIADKADCALDSDNGYAASSSNLLQPSGTSASSKKFVGTSLITGGCGVLGIKFAQWLVDRGVRHLILCGRQAPSPEVRQIIVELERKGAKIDVAQVDVNNPTEVSELLAQIKNSEQQQSDNQHNKTWHPLRNIFHLAGVIDDKELAQQTWEQFNTVLAPKVLGTWNLHILTQDISLDNFVVFSSIVSLLGASGQSNYAAANAFMDALMHYRRAKGLPGLSLNWGAWSEAKVASHFDSHLQQHWKDYLNQRWQEAGIELITPNRGFQVLRQTLRSSVPQVGIIPIDWSQFSQTAGINQQPLLSNFIKPSTSLDTAPIRIPLSEAQKQLWILAQVSEAGSRAYHTSAYLELQGQLKLEFLKQSVQQVVDRHEALRTVIDSQGEWQQILPSMTIEVLLTDYSSEFAEVENTRQTQLSTWLRQKNCQLFNLTTGPLLRIEVLKLAPQRHVLIIIGHHIVVDGWSAENILQEIGLFYSSLCNGSVTSLESPLQFREFLTWQNQQSQTEGMKVRKSFWLKQLAIKPPTLELPTDRIRPPVKTYRASRQQLELDPRFCQQLRSFSQQQGCTLFMTLLTGYLILLHRLSGQNEILVGIPSSGRVLPKSQTMVGYASHLLPIQSLLEKEPITVQDFLARIRTKLLDAYDHQDYPFAELLNQLNLESDRSRSDLVSVIFNLEPPIPTMSMGDLDTKLLSRPLDFNHYDLEFNFIDLKTHLVLEANYNSDLFEKDTIERWMSHFCVVLNNLIRNPQQDVAKLPLLTKKEHYQMLEEWNDTDAEYCRHKCVHELFEAQANRTPNALSVVFEDEQLSYQDLNKRANQLAYYLQSLGVKSEALVGICVKRSVDMVVGLLGILKAGGVYIPLDPNYPHERLSYMLEDSNVSILLTQESLLKTLPEHTEQVVCLDADWETIEQHDYENLNLEVSPNNLAYVIYTSGSTGQPKGVLVTHQNLVNHSSAIMNEYNINSSDKVLQFAAFSFDVVVEEIFPSLLSGATVVLRPQEFFASFADLVEFIEVQRLTVLNLPAAFWHEWVIDLSQSQKHLPSCLRLLVVGSEKVQWSKVAMWQKYAGRHIKLYNAYGSTEATITSAIYQTDLSNTENKSGIVPIGRPVANTQLYILDSNFQPVPIGVTGELHIGGDSLVRGYLNRSELTKEKFVPNPFSNSKSQRLYRTGDLARYLSDGNIEFLGRIDNQVKVRGFRIELGEIESALNTHPQVQQAVVIAKEDTSKNKRLVAYIVAINCSLTSYQLCEFLKPKLPKYMIPSAFITLETLPLMVNGKIDRKALPVPDWETLGTQQYVAPRTAIEQTLTHIWQKLLLKEKVSIHDNFFEIGGDSILSIQVVSRAKNSGIEITTNQIFHNQTIAELARVANTKVSVTAQQGLVTGEAPLTPIQHWFLAQKIQEPHHYNQSVLLHLHKYIKPQLLKKALGKLLEHHDVLRSRFTLNSGNKQMNQGLDDTVPFNLVDLSSTPKLEQAQALSEVAAEFQASLNLSSGPIMQMVMFDLGNKDNGRLLIIIHHLIVDGVSWRILLSDLETIYQQLSIGQPIQLDTKTTAFINWSEKLNNYAQSETAKQELDYWLDRAWSQTKPLPLDYARSDRENTVASAASVSVKLSVEKTRALLGAVNEAYNTQINDLLLSALVLALTNWTKNSSIAIDLEGHGREELFKDIDLSRTVGWFTSLFPVLLQLPTSAQAAEVIKSIKEQLRLIPNRGIGYGILSYLCEDTAVKQQLQTIPTPEICFNYLGQFDQMQSQMGWKLASESTGANYSSKQIRSHLLDVDALVVEGELQIDWTYSSNFHTRAIVESLAHGYIQAINSIIEHCQSKDAFEYTPSDFSLAQLNQKELDELLSEFKTEKIESIYPLSPMQQGMLFHSLYAPESGVYFDRITFNLEGNINCAAFKSAWQKVVDRHSVFRTFFVWENRQTPLQIVLKQVDLPWNNLNWQELSPSKQQRQLKELLQRQIKQGFRFNQAPLMNCTLIQLNENTYTFIWNHHHILIDGWCLSIIFKEVLSLYEAALKDKTLYLPKPAPYQNYIAWLNSQDQETALKFWQQNLQDFKAPSSLMKDKTKYQQQQPGNYEKLQLSLSAWISRQLQSFAQEHHLTLSTIVKAAWGLLLSRYSGEKDIVFGVTVSGRSSDVSEVENMLGLLINTLPLRLQIYPQQQLIPWLQQVQQSILKLHDYSYTQLVDIRARCEIPTNVPLFESLVGFENYPIDNSLFDEDGLLQPSKIESFGQNNYPLTVVAVPRDELLIEIRYDALHFEKDKIKLMLKHMESIFSAITENYQQTVGKLVLLQESEKQKLLNKSLKKLKRIKRNPIKAERVAD